jgi:ribosomal protein S13
MIFNNSAIRYSQRPFLSCVSSFQRIYGIGRVRAKCINTFLLNHPRQLGFHREFNTILRSNVCIRIPFSMGTERALRLYIVQKLQDKILIFTYPMYRLFQNLGMKGQSSRSTGKRSKKNPYLVLNLNPSFYTSLSIAYYRRQLIHNGKPEELKKFDKSLIEKEKNKKQARKDSTKATREAYRREMMNKTK